MHASLANSHRLLNDLDIPLSMESFCTYKSEFEAFIRIFLFGHIAYATSYRIWFSCVMAFCSVQRSDGVDETIEIPDVMFNAGRLRQRNFYDDILVALTRQPLQQVDAAVTQGVRTNFDSIPTIFDC